MKKIIVIFGVVLFIAVLIIVFVNILYAQAPASKDIGRYQLFQGTYTWTNLAKNRADKEVSIFLLDTSTGKVKMYNAGVTPDGRDFEHWAPTL